MTKKEIFEQCGQIFNFILENIKKVGILFSMLPEFYYSIFASLFGITTDELKKIITTFNEFKNNLKIVVTYYTITIFLCATAFIIVLKKLISLKKRIKSRRNHR